MVLLWPVALGLVVGLLRWRGVGYLCRLQLRHGWLFLTAVALQLGSVLFVAPGPPGEFDLRGALLLLGYLAVLAGVVSNLHLPAMWVLGLGFLLNLLVILPQGGYMPVTVEAYEAAGQLRPGEVYVEGEKLPRAKDIILSRERTPFWPLSDVLPVREPRLLRGVYSPGDLVIGAGVVLLLSGVGLGGGVKVQGFRLASRPN